MNGRSAFFDTYPNDLSLPSPGADRGHNRPVGAYNRLIAQAQEPCPQCGRQGDVAIQFKWGQCYLHNYRLGDALQWSDGTVDQPLKGPLDKGDPTVSEVRLPASAEPCAQCGSELDHEYEITIRHNRIAAYRFAGWG